MTAATRWAWGVLIIGFGINTYATPTKTKTLTTRTRTPGSSGGSTGPSLTKTKTPELGESSPPASLDECSNCKIYDCAGGAARHRDHFSTQKRKGVKKAKSKSTSRSSKDIAVGKYDSDADVKYKDFEKWCKAGGNVADYGATAPVIWAKDPDCNDLYHCPAFTPVKEQSKKCGIGCASDISGASAVSLLVIILLIVGCVCCSVVIGIYLFLKAGKKAKEVLEGEETGGYDEDPTVYGEADYEEADGETGQEDAQE